MSAPARTVRAVELTLELGSRPWLMGIVNAAPDSISDGGRYTGLDAQLQLAHELIGAGADILDIGGECASTVCPPVEPEREIERVAALVERVVAELGALVSVDTHKPPVARAAIAAGARIVNDVSGLRDPELADVCAQTGTALVITHTHAAPRERRQDPSKRGDVVAEVLASLAERSELACGLGVSPEQLILDPGLDFAETPAQTIGLLGSIERMHELGRPLLLAISRKDFIAALAGRTPSERLAGTLAALDHGVEQGAHIFRVHDVAAAADFLTVRSALRGELEPGGDLTLAEGLRRDRVPSG